MPQGQAAVPPLSKHASIAKSRENHQSIAFDIAFCNVASLFHCVAFAQPPWYTAAIITKVYV